MKDVDDDDGSEKSDASEKSEEEEEDDDDNEEEGGKTFKYKSDFDKNGILYYIATSYGKSSYVNPHQSGKIEVKASCGLGTGQVSQFVDNQFCSAWVSASGASFILIDFKKSKIKIKKYSMKTFNQSCCYPRGWNIEGSTNDKKYDIIQKYSDSSINSSGATKTFDVKNCKKFYRFIKIHNTVQSSSNWNWGTQVEFYGQFKK